MSQKNQIKSTSVKNEAMSTTVLQDGLDKLFKSGYSLIDLNHAEVQKLGLPHTACTGNHYIKAHLFVTDSGTVTGLPAHRIGQTLVFTPCNDGNTEIYMRTGEISGENTKWGKWEKLATATELAQALEQFKPTGAEAVEWGVDSCINTFVEQGTYNISGERLNVADGLPIANSNPGHTISARLVVLDSSISGTGKDTDKCITQILTLSNRTGGDGDIFVRTGRAASINALAGGNGWEPWGKLQQNIGVGQVTSLDCYIDNGMYSGVYTDGNTFFETFVMVVINNYAVAGATGRVRSVSQFKYALNVDGTFSYKTRTGQGNTGIAWGDWVDIGAATTADIQDNSITAQKLSTDVREKVNNPLRPLFIAAGAKYDEITGLYSLNGVTGLSESDIALSYSFKDVVYRLNISRVLQNIYNIKALFPHRGTVQSQQVFKNAPLNGTGTFSATSLEIIRVNAATTNLNETNLTNILPCSGDVWSATFLNCSNLREVWPINVTNVPRFATDTFKGTPLLVELRLYGLSNNIEFSDSRVISKASILYIVNNAVPTTSAITITLHPDAYARLADDIDIVAALEAQPLISLVSA